MEVSIGHSLGSFIIFAQNTHNFNIILQIQNIETKFPAGEHYLDEIAKYLEQLVGKTLFKMLHLCVYLHLLHFVSLLTRYAVERTVVADCHAYIKGNGPKLADWSK